MKTKRATALIILALIAISAATAYAAVTVKREFTLPAFEGYPYRPRVTGDWVIANQNSEKNNNTTCKAVNIYNLVTNEVTCAFDGKALWPEAGGNYAIWTATPEEMQAFFSGDPKLGRSGSNLVIFDLASSRYYTPGLRTGHAYQCDVWGDYAVWTSRGQGYLCYADLKTGKQYQLTGGPGQRYQPTICGSLIVWLDDPTNGKATGNSAPLQLRAFDFASNRRYEIPQNPDVRHNGPCTDGQTIVWWESGKTNVVMGYDIKTSKVSTIADGYFPDIDNGIVVYMKKDSAVYGKDLKTGREFRISKGISNQGPSISGKWVVWTVSSQDNKIHCAELTGK